MDIRFLSPDGKYYFQIDLWEVSLSVWIEVPRLVEGHSERILFDLTGEGANWSLDFVKWADEEHVKMQLRHYPGDHRPSVFDVEVDCVTEQAVVGGETIPLESIKEHLEALYRCSQMSPRFTVFARFNQLVERFFKVR